MTNDAVDALLNIRESEFRLLSSPLIDGETEEQRVAKLYVLRGAGEYEEGILKTRPGIYAEVSRRFPGLVGLALSGARRVTERIRAKYTEEINQNEANRIRLDDRNSREQGSFSFANPDNP